MGVHYFYTWITTRYPIIKAEYSREIAPQVDHLYLDMNGVLYLCATDQSGAFKDLLCPRTADRVLADIFGYLNWVVGSALPRKSLYIGIDGVSPSCKTLSQRRRRFASAQTLSAARAFLRDALGEDAGALGVNCITPGSGFMLDVVRKIRFFVLQKLAEDARWRGLRVYVSGDDVPGEGEHKLLEHIRRWKQSPEFDVNETHCIYGADSDLILLGLSLHLPNLFILRESYPPYEKRVVNAAAQRSPPPRAFDLVFISLLREYISLEFNARGDRLERLIDDYVFVCIFLGNDFLPSLYCMNAKMGCFDDCLDALRRFYQTRGGFLTRGAEIDWAALAALLKMFVPLQVKMLDETLGEFEYAINDFQKKAAKQTNTKSVGKFRGRKAFDFAEMADALDAIEPKVEEQSAIERTETNRLKCERMKAAAKKIRQAREILISKKDLSEFYYGVYLTSDEQGPKGISKLCHDYLHTMTFVLQYYRHGCPSWDWAYSAPIAPLLTDLCDYLNAPTAFPLFKLGEPVPALIQMLQILPFQSLNMVPSVLVSSALEAQSPIANHYPKDYVFAPVDQIKDHTWKPNVRLVPQEAMEAFTANVNWENVPGAAERNAIGCVTVYKYDQNRTLNVKSVIWGFPDFEAHISFEQVPNLPPLHPSLNDNYEYIKDFKGGRLPSLHFLPGLTLQRDKPGRGKWPGKRDVFLICLTNESFSELCRRFKEIAPRVWKSDKEPITLYLGPFFPRPRRVTGVETIIPKDKRYAAALEDIADQFSKAGCTLDSSVDLRAFFPSVPLLQLADVLFTRLEGRQPKAIFVAAPMPISVPFSAVSLVRQYPSMRMCAGQPPTESVLSLSLLTGELTYAARGRPTEVLREAAATGSTAVRCDSDGFSRPENSWLQSVGIPPKAAIALWALLDSLRVGCDARHNSAALLGDAIDIGLNFIAFFGRSGVRKAALSGYVSLRRHNRRLPSESVCWIAEGPQNHIYELLLSEKARECVERYAEQNPAVIAYLVENYTHLNASETGLLGPKNQIPVCGLFAEAASRGEDVNLRLFRVYATLAREEHATRPLRSAFGFYYPAEAIAKLSIPSPNPAKAQRQSALERIVFDPNDECLIPTLLSEPPLHSLGDRVAAIGGRNPQIPFGAAGTVTGLYADSVEVLFDAPFIGGDDLDGRGPPFRGSVLPMFEVFNLTRWPQLLAREQSNCANAWEGAFDVGRLAAMISQFEGGLARRAAN